MIAFAPSPRFSLGETVITPGAAAKIPPDDIQTALRGHAQGDWGELDAANRAANDRALKGGTAIASIFLALNGVKFYVITEGDRSRTTVLLPEEY
jgi:hypothetical protein